MATTSVEFRSIWQEIKRVKAKSRRRFSGFFERLAATYSRGSYTTTTIGHAVFDGRVRNGNGSDHCGNATKLFIADFDRKKNLLKIVPGTIPAIL
jgi:hypothetical protein